MDFVDGNENLLIVSYLARVLAETKVKWDPAWVAGIRDWGGVPRPTPTPPPGEVLRKLADAADAFERRSTK